MDIRFCVSFLLMVVLLLLPSEIESVAVMSVDLGSEWMKIAIVSPGVPMEIALNKESKRKTPVTIAFRDGERTFGEDAATLGVRFPKNSYSYLLELLGKRVDNPVVQLYKQRFPYYNIVPDPERDTVLFQHDSETLYSPEELLAMLLHRAREFAQDSAGQPINEAVLTVPGFFNQAERRALLKAAELAGLKILQLMNDYTAVALNYGIFRRKDFNETPQYIMFYDMGATSTSAAIVSYQLVKTKEKGYVETNPQLSIIGVGYDRTLGGLEMQLRLRDFLGKKFNEMKKTSNDVFKNPRAMAKLFKEAGRLKNVLSANADHFAQVEGLLDEQDFKLQVMREDFETLCSDLFDRVKGPIDQALKSSGLTLDVINHVILVGAGTRVPKVQEKLSEIVAMELGKSINTDEAAAMGAVYKAADLSNGFKVKKFLTKDAVLFPIQVVFERDVEGSASPKHVKRTLFGPMNPFPQKKILTFNKHQHDFSFYVSYAELDHLSHLEMQALGPLNLSRVELTGVAEAVAKHLGNNVESKGIKAHFSMDESGLLNLANVELVVEKTLTEEELAAQEESPLSKLGSTISNFFTGSEEKKEEKVKEKPVNEGEEKKQEPENNEGKTKEEERKDEKPPQQGRAEETEEKKKEAPNDAKNASKAGNGERKPKVVVIKEEITSFEDKLGVPDLKGKLLEEARNKIEALNEFDRQRSRRESALNALESFVFDAQGKLWLDEYQAAATEEEIEKIKQSCSEVSDWLYDKGSDAEAATYEAKLSELKTLTGPLYRRVKEHMERPEALAALHSMLNGSSNFLASARNMTTDSPDGLFTQVELDTLEKVIKETQEWKTTMEEEQSSLPPSATPKLTVKSITEKMALLDREVKYLVNKAKIWKPKKLRDDIVKDTAKNETDEEVFPKNEKSDAEKEAKIESEETQEDKGEPVLEREENGSETLEEAEATLSQPQESTTGLPEDTSSNSGEDDATTHTEL
ncbi:Hypoxia up-regulated protein 1 [Cryptotermes secundus]|uniref:Hypoxia up-regulated protein 1 n=1 Tax=Cryptotermes secundus TaxID=105785 RepID=A0A2J7PUI5_9NEOP|nr:hypoxia up-regulated protein 1 isoform X2 [Cryptotermes secundus]PNF19992.1 Hypoxia up-regulated protein 1 [Cryptotermes secundus]